MKLVITGAASAVCSAVLPVIEREESITEILAIDVKKPESHFQKSLLVGARHAVPLRNRLISLNIFIVRKN